MKELIMFRVLKHSSFALVCSGMLTVSLVGCGNTTGGGAGSASCDDLAQQLANLQGDPSSLDFQCQSIDLNIQAIDEDCIPAQQGVDLDAFRQQAVDLQQQLGCP